MLPTAILCPSAPGFSLREVGSFDRPVSIAPQPSDPSRLLIGERPGRIVEAGGPGVRQVADLSSLVGCCEVERGLLSIVPGPAFDADGRIYVAYTGTAAAGGEEGDVHLDSFRPDPATPGQLIREPILAVEHAALPNHNGGQLRFGPDGHLYVSLGDGGGEGDPSDNAQDVESLLGKILRIDPQPGQAPSYSVPADNPFVGTAGRDEIWAYGLRNPWRFSFDRLTGDMVIGDVGQAAREEVDFAPSPEEGVVSGGGADYGWNCREGLIAYTAPGALCATAGPFVEPVFDYVHQNPVGGAANGCAIIGGVVVRDPGLDALQGRYVYSDFCAGQIRSLMLPASAEGHAGDDRSEAPSIAEPTTFGEDACGRVYLASEEGPVYQLVGSSDGACPSSAAAAGGVGTLGQGRTRPARLRLRATRHGRSFAIVVRVSPCAGHPGERVRLYRGGRPLASKRLDRSCAARFRARVDRPASFRALLLGEVRVRSRRLSLRPPPRGRG